MSKRVNRRTFIKRGTVISASSLAGLTGLTRILPARNEGPVSTPDMAVFTGSDYHNNTRKAIEKLGGMDRFVPQQAKVAILANVQRNHPGTYTNPEILRAVIKMCWEAGAGEVNCISWLPEKNWENTGLKGVIGEEKANLLLTPLKDESRFKPVAVPGGKKLKTARIMESYFYHDVFINMPITKDHAGNKFTGTLKNLMGINSPGSNRTFHLKNWTTDVNAIAHLDQCIADLNTVVKPTLNVVDATEFITTNGPFGPGKLLKPQKIVAGCDRVAIDSYCCRLWGLEVKDIFMINGARSLRLGESDLGKVKIYEDSASSAGSSV